MMVDGMVCFLQTTTICDFVNNVSEDNLVLQNRLNSYPFLSLLTPKRWIVYSKTCSQTHVNLPNSLGNVYSKFQLEALYHHSSFIMTDWVDPSNLQKKFAHSNSH